MKYLNDINYRDCVGKICRSLNSGEFKILKYNDTANVEIQFLKTGFETTVRLGDIKSGKVKDKYLPSVCGVGIVGIKYPISEGGAQIKEYTLWNSMLKRCYSDCSKKKRPTYEGCKVSDNFKSYEYFYEWCNKQIGFNSKDWQLDKDLLVKGNKIYSEDSCVFLPHEINTVLIKCTASRGEYLIGVHWSKKDKTFVARVNNSKGKREYLGSFKTEIEAFNTYKIAKESYLKELANKWKGEIDGRAYEALMSYEVEITD